jgi:Kef-type K+ transport system membrane component KefB
MNRHVVIYVAVLALFALGIGTILKAGARIPPSPSTAHVVDRSTTHTADRPPEGTPTVWASLNANAQRPLSQLLVQLVLIVLAARGMGYLFSRAGQPAVVGEMVAGVLLGPSLLGWLWPNAFRLIFPPASLEMPRLLSEIGVCLFLFAQGMELDPGHVRQRAPTAVMVSHISIVFPYLLGAAAALLLFPGLAGPGTSFTAFALFMGIAMSVTAFPVLARIIEERQLTRTSLGSTVLTCAAVDDVTAWSGLAIIVAVVGAGSLAAAAAGVGVLLVFVGAMMFVIRPLLARWIGRDRDDREPGPGLMAAVLAFVFGSALVTQVAGIHALFGSFMAGIVMPRRGALIEHLKVRIEGFSGVFLLPIFFAYTGLRTEVGLLSDAGAWLTCGGLIAIATVGKLGGSACAARSTGMGWRDAFAIGALMNTRGLMELIALNVGYDLGILSPRIFSMLVLMALVTTFLTGPLLKLVRLETVPSVRPAEAA